MHKPLSGVTVIDLTHMLSGPYCAMLMADLGARTIKVEPLAGEGTRALLAKDPAHSIEGMGAYFLTLNRNKESVAIDLKTAGGKALFLDIVRKADVVVNNFGPGVPKKLGIDWETLAKINPRIITCSITGFGETGPANDRPAFDMVAQGMGGGMSITGLPGGMPLRAGIPIGDLGGGLFGAIGILSALQARERSGVGQHVDISMLDAQVSLLNYMATMYFLSGEPPSQLGNGHFVHVPYNTFRTADRWLIIAIITDAGWLGLREALADPELMDETYLTQPGRFAAREVINTRVEAVLMRRSCEYWLAHLADHRVPCAPVNDFPHALSDPQVLARGMVVEVAHPGGRTVKMPGNPVKLSGAGEPSYTSPPLLGQDTDSVLAGLLGKSATEIAALRARKVIG